MIINIIYLLIGVCIGFLVKHELDIKYKRKRVETKKNSLAHSPLNNDGNETLECIRELNHSLTIIQKEKEV